MESGDFQRESSPGEVGHGDGGAEPKEVEPDVLEGVVAREEHDHPEMPTPHACPVQLGRSVGGHQRWLG